MAALVAAIYLGELISMLFVEQLGSLSVLEETLLDATLLLCITFPFVYFFAFRPLSRHLSMLARAQDEVQAKNAELLKANQLALESQQRYLDLFNRSPDGYVVLDQYGDVCELNRTGAALLGVTLEDALHRNMDSWLSAEEGEHWHEFRRCVLRSSGKKSCKLVLRREDGHTFYALLDCLCENSVAGVLIRVSFTDITEENFTAIHF